MNIHLKNILESHKLWLSSSKEGEKADLRSADLRFANLRSADLRSANLEDANLQVANLQGANLEDANLQVANLRSADLRSADLRSADLRFADLQGANLEDANLQVANLQGANLQGANLLNAYMEEATLPDPSRLPDYKILPEEGSFVAWKKVHGGIVKLKIPHDAKRTSTLVGRKCRAEFVDVLEAAKGAFSIYEGQKTFYTPGQRIYPHHYDTDIRVECSAGIHFFLTREEAEKWSIG